MISSPGLFLKKMFCVLLVGAPVPLLGTGALRGGAPSDATSGELPPAVGFVAEPSATPSSPDLSPDPIEGEAALPWRSSETARETSVPTAQAAATPVGWTPSLPPTSTTTAPRTSTTMHAEVFLACVRHRESRGDYTVVNPSSGTAGAYQFHQATWDTVARVAGRTDLVGVRPNYAFPAAQDQLARVLYQMEGTKHWGGWC